MPLHPPDFGFDPAELRRAFEQRPKALVLCNPSNPCGKVFTREELLYIARLAEEFDTFVFTDEVYEHIVYAPHRHTYFAALPGMFERTISCSSLSKTYSITGWRLGYVIARSGDYRTKPARYTTSSTVGAAAPSAGRCRHRAGIARQLLRRSACQATPKSATCFSAISTMPRLTYSRPQGAYYVMVDISRIRDGTTMLNSASGWPARWVSPPSPAQVSSTNRCAT